MLNMRFSPSTGFIFDSSGLSFSVVKTPPAWRNSDRTPATAAGMSATAVIVMSAKAALAPSAPAAAVNDPPLATAAKPSSNSVTIRVAAKPAPKTRTISQTSSVTVAVTSFDLATSPFLRASASRLGVGRSVLSPPSFFCATPHSRIVAGHQ